MKKIHRGTVQKNIHDPDNHLEPNILQCELKWALGSITTRKASGGDRIPVELFQILKDDAMKGLHSTYHQIWKILPWPQDWKRSVFTPIAKKGNYRELCNYCTVAFISHATKLMLKILQVMLQQYINHELLHIQVGFQKDRGTKIKLPTSAGSLKNEESSRRTSSSVLLRF